MKTHTKAVVGLAAVLGLVGAVTVTNDRAQAIVGGAPADGGRPFMGSLSDAFGDQEKHLCGAVLIRPQWAVTANHCTFLGATQNEARFLKVRFGSAKWNSGGQHVGVSRIVRYSESPEWSGTDIALLKLSEPVSGAHAVISTTRPGNGTGITLLGWGRTCGRQKGCENSIPENLKQLKTVTAAADACAGGNYAPAAELCVRADPKQTVCKGDSGGPALAATQNGWALAGIASRKINPKGDCGASNFAYSDVGFFRPWIDRTVSADQAKAPAPARVQVPSPRPAAPQQTGGGDTGGSGDNQGAAGGWDPSSPVLPPWINVQ